MFFCKRAIFLITVAVMFLLACNQKPEENKGNTVRIVKGLYSYGPEIKSFTDCEEGTEYWVADSARTLELQYSKFNFERPYEPVYIEAEAHFIKSDSLIVSADFDSTMVVTRVLKITREIPDGPCK
ncbi:hypothetical protein [Pedobacter sp. JY14-1]|uniref:hypothetical protein n=1 Tax=Pedobacter sp. JY14-1 TaxID=3034151 RepID=UPI0023E3404D|nr:hypothetical protein [Pedobacter sp. JY14-1]